MKTAVDSSVLFDIAVLRPWLNREWRLICYLFSSFYRTLHMGYKPI